MNYFEAKILGKNSKFCLSPKANDKLSLLTKFHPEKQNGGYILFGWTDQGMGKLFSKLYGNTVKFCPDKDKWMVYNKNIWEEDADNVFVSENLKKFIDLLGTYAITIPDEELKQNFTKFINSLSSKKTQESILNSAAMFCIQPIEKFDRNPYLINCQNGTFDLETLSFYQNKKSDYLTMRTNFSYDKKAHCKRWDEFIKQITENDDEKADYLQRALGYSLLGRNPEECMFILWGKTTRNGKSTLLNAIKKLLGDYSAVAPVEMITRSTKFSNNAESPSPVLASLKGCRFVTMAESTSYGTFNEEQIKQFTGGEEITARELRKDPFTFLPQFTMWLSCNDLPLIDDKSLFSSRRLRVIEFTKHFDTDEQDIHLKEKFETEKAKAGIFNWLVDGYKKYKEYGLSMSQNMLKTIDEYEVFTDTIENFLTERCLFTGNKDNKIKQSDLYKTYRNWARANGEEISSARKFNSEMEKHSRWYIKKSFYNGYPVWTGIEFRGGDD